MKFFISSRAEFDCDSLNCPQELNSVTEYWAGHICNAESVPPHTVPLKSGSRIEHMLASTEQNKNCKTIGNFCDLKWDFHTS